MFCNYFPFGVLIINFLHTGCRTRLGAVEAPLLSLLYLVAICLSFPCLRCFVLSHAFCLYFFLVFIAVHMFSVRLVIFSLCILCVFSFGPSLFLCLSLFMFSVPCAEGSLIACEPCKSKAKQQREAEQQALDWRLNLRSRISSATSCEDLEKSQPVGPVDLKCSVALSSTNVMSKSLLYFGALKIARIQNCSELPKTNLRNVEVGPPSDARGEAMRSEWLQGLHSLASFVLGAILPRPQQQTPPPAV